MYGLHFQIQETQGFLHKFRFKADLKDAVRKKAAGEPGGNPGQCPLLYWSSGIS